MSIFKRKRRPPAYSSAVSSVYDIINAELSPALWCDFIEERFEKYLERKPELLLDLACGTGSITHELSLRGYDMTGVDISPDMLMVAREKCAEDGALFLCQDMRSFELYGTVGAVVCCLDSLNHLTGEGDLERCFSLVHNYTDPGGLFIFDVNTPKKISEVYADNTFTYENLLPDGKRSLCIWQNSVKDDICRFALSLFTETDDGLYERSDEEWSERIYTDAYIKNVLSACGFSLLESISDPDFCRGAASGRTFYTARVIKN